jgi:hypothetical protein
MWDTKQKGNLSCILVLLVAEMNNSSINGGNPYKKTMNVGLHSIHVIRPIAHVFLSEYIYL